jgi:outer membrane protein OmpA-like peptidoglycan-associated protein
MMKTTLRAALVASLVLPVIAGCGTTMPPAELVSARESYAKASHGNAQKYKPDELHDAKVALDKAERSFDDSKDSPETKDLAYAADMKSQEAEALGGISVAEKEKAETEKKLSAYQVDTIKKTQKELAQTKEDLKNERRAREDAEKKAAQAMADLQRIAAVKQEQRGMVITLSGSVLFPSGESSLLPSAMLKLNEVADALTKSNPDSKIVVEGHTDSQGKASFNQELSVARATSVRNYLVSRGMAADRISAQGMGSSKPIASNNSAEGRAENRRVEIVVQPSP